MRLSVIIPVFNEKEYIEACVARVLAQPVVRIADKQVIIVDDGSTDGTTEKVKAIAAQHPKEVIAVYHSHNKGKGAAIRSAIKRIEGDLCIIQDADLEYDPADYNIVLPPILDGKADCVYGSRFLGGRSVRVLFFWHMVGNRLITLLSNMCTNLTFTDIETGYKAFRSEILKSIRIRSNDFRFEVEITTKIARLQCRIYEVGISYTGRTYSEGKKIGWVDGVKAIGAIFRFFLFKDDINRETTPAARRVTAESVEAGNS